MTQFACGRKSRSSVRRIIRPAVVLLMARVAQRAIQRIVVVYVTIRALPWRHSVRSRQLETCSRVVERAIGPEHCVVARLASRRETRRDVVHGCERIRVVGLVARHTGRAREVVVVIHVAIGTLPRRNSMRSGQCEPGAVVVEGRVQPGTGVVTLLAGLREI